MSLNITSFFDRKSPPLSKQHLHEYFYLQLHIYYICLIIGYTIAAPSFEKPENQFTEIAITEEIPELVSRDEEIIHHPREIIFEIIETKDDAQTKDVLVVDEIVDASVFENDDLELAETHLFRPLFRYRAQIEKRERLSKSRG